MQNHTKQVLRVARKISVGILFVALTFLSACAANSGDRFELIGQNNSGTVSPNPSGEMGTLIGQLGSGDSAVTSAKSCHSKDGASPQIQVSAQVGGQPTIWNTSITIDAEPPIELQTTLTQYDAEHLVLSAEALEWKYNIPGVSASFKFDRDGKHFEQDLDCKVVTTAAK